MGDCGERRRTGLTNPNRDSSQRARLRHFRQTHNHILIEGERTQRNSREMSRAKITADPKMAVCVFAPPVQAISIEVINFAASATDKDSFNANARVIIVHVRERIRPDVNAAVRRLNARFLAEPVSCDERGQSARSFRRRSGVSRRWCRCRCRTIPPKRDPRG